MIKSVLNQNNKKLASRFFNNIIKTGVNFKLDDRLFRKSISEKEYFHLISDLPEQGESLGKILKEFQKKILPHCTNFSSPNFMSFPDAGNSIAAIGGSFLSDLLQQNLINQSFCAPSGVFVEISVIKWLRSILGYQNKNIDSVLDVGGIITTGGTLSNTIALLLARENKFPDTMTHGVNNLPDSYIVVPKGISHYSIKNGQMWIGLGSKILEVETKNFRYDLEKLEETLKVNKGKILALVAYAGDSRTMTIDYFDKIANLAHAADPSIWLHADACHGFSLAFSKKLKHKLRGIEEFDSISLDPHKVFLVPYAAGALLIKDPSKFKTIFSTSDLIMQEKFAFGQITPFLGSRAWTSLKLWFMMKNFGKKGLAQLIEKRVSMARYFTEKIKKTKKFIVLNNTDINSVMFVYNKGSRDIEMINWTTKKMHETLMRDGKFHLHQFNIIDPGIIHKDVVLYPLRFMCGNPNTTKKHIDLLVKYIDKIGDEASKIYIENKISTKSYG